jgi:dTDP-4-amino-4,6-dideoxygalactose transaminase
MATTNDASIAIKLKKYYDESGKMSPDEIQGLLKSVFILYHRYKNSLGWLTGDIYYLLFGKRFSNSTTQLEINGSQPPNYRQRMSAPVAVLGLNQLKKIDKYNEKRRITAESWMKWCLAKGYVPPRVIENSQPVFLRFPFLVNPKLKLGTKWLMRELKVQPGVWFISNLHPANGTIPGCPNAAKAVAQCINLPGVLR